MDTGSYDSLNSVYGLDENNVFLYGVGGRMLYWNGEKWDYREPNTIHDLFGMWGEDMEHIHAVGGEGIYRFYDGKVFHRREDLTDEEVSLFGIWGTHNDNIYICGSHGTVLHFDGDGLETDAIGDRRIPLEHLGNLGGEYLCGRG